jgi:hypothetical protein
MTKTKTEPQKQRKKKEIENIIAHKRRRETK